LRITCNITDVEYKCEITLENRLGLNNSRYLADLGQNLPNLRIFGLLLRYWAKKQQMVDNSVHSMNNYTLVLMFVAFLRELQLLPPLDEVETSTLDLSTSQGFIRNWQQTWSSESINFLKHKAYGYNFFLR